MIDEDEPGIYVDDRRRNSLCACPRVPFKKIIHTDECIRKGRSPNQMWRVLNPRKALAKDRKRNEKRRILATSAGLCSMCSKRQQIAGRRRCRECTDANRLAVDRYKAKKVTKTKPEAL